MKINTQRKTKGFTLVEMIGVLAVIAILAAMLIPKIFSVINNACIEITVTAINTIKQAAADSFSKYGALTSDGTGAILRTNAAALADPGWVDFGSALLGQGFIDKPFAVKIGNQSTGTKVQIRLIVTTAISATTANYDLDGNAALDTSNGQLVVECAIAGVTAQECKDIKDIIDGTTLGAVSVGSAATVGRVKYGTITAGQTGTALIYITHM